MAKVYIPNKTSHDYSEAWDFGELVFCTTGELHRLDIRTMQIEMERAMHNATEEDYILVSSLTQLCSVACAVFAQRFGCLNLLIIDGGRYHARTINLKGTPA
ncbi:MAG TPA: hypothetical protein VF077_09020 [Nitrospiraceae bacterium]